METSLHRDLKLHYAVDEYATEVEVDGFRIDAISTDGALIEVQHASLAALRSKTEKLLSKRRNRVTIVKPIIVRKRVTTLAKVGGEVIRSRMSPCRGDLLDVFEDLVHFSTVFPKRRLTLELALIEMEEIRIDRTRPTRRGKRYKTVDQRLVSVHGCTQLSSKSDLLDMLPLEHLPNPFDTAELAAAIGRKRWFAQKVAYCLRKTGAAKMVGKRGNSQLYKVPPSAIRKTKGAA